MKKILVVIDMQNDFIDGSLGTKEAESIVDKVVEKIVAYSEETILITKDTHEEDYLTTAEGKALPVPHCIKGSQGWELNKKIATMLEGVKTFEKPIFASEALAEFLEKEFAKEIFEVELVGLCTDICVVSNAILLKTKIPELKITVDASCCAGVTPKTHEAALSTMAMCQIIIK